MNEARIEEGQGSIHFAQDDSGYLERWSVGESQTRSAAARPSETLPEVVERVRV